MNRTPAKPGHEGKQLTIRDLFPDLSEEQLKEVEETFHGYLEVVWEIYEEVKRERPEAFDSTFVSSPGVRNGLFRRVGPEPACTTRIMGAGEAASSPKPRLCSRMQTGPTGRVARTVGFPRRAADRGHGLVDRKRDRWRLLGGLG